MDAQEWVWLVLCVTYGLGVDVVLGRRFLKFVEGKDDAGTVRDVVDACLDALTWPWAAAMWVLDLLDRI